MFRGTIRGTPVAIKRLQAGSADATWQTEIDMLTRLSHPNVVQLLGSCAPNLLVCAYSEGGSLDQRLRRDNGARALSGRSRMLILSDVVRGLAYLHSLRPPVIHRDLKPGNILLDHGAEPRALLGDFGIARALSSQSSATATHLQTGSVLGTVLYMAPEMVKGHVSTLADSYAFGLIVFESLLGRLAHEQMGEHENLVLAIDEGELDDASSLFPLLDPHVSTDVGGWDGLAPSVTQLHSLATRCLEHRKRARPECRELVGPMEAIRAEVEKMAGPVDGAFVCPISLEVMADPVTAADGCSYARAAIEAWLQSGKTTSPMTGKPLAHLHLNPNLSLRQLIEKQRPAARGP